MEIAREAGRRQARGDSIARFDVGQPHWGAPPEALDFIAHAMAAEPMGYSDGLGLPALRAAIARHYGDTYDIDLSPDRIAVTTGASGAFLLTFLALFDVGANVAIAAPGYPPYRHILRALGLNPVILDADPAEGLQLTARLLQTAGAIDGALIASPANPTGAMLSDDALSAMCAAMAERGKPLISDEIYHGLTYDRPATTALAFDPEAFIVNSFSKYWAMTGWRVGWIVAPERFIRPLERLAQNLTVAPPTVSQIAAIGALRATETCEARRQVYAGNRALMLDALPRLGLPLVAAPAGAFYVLTDVSASGLDGMAFAQAALEAGVALTPGADFCDAHGARWARLAYCRPRDEIEEGLARLAALTSGLR
jgi:aspartate/methionine/tyrosine aminotransferase